VNKDRNNKLHTLQLGSRTRAATFHADGMHAESQRLSSGFTLRARAFNQ
jgi:hypothetical protein